MKKLEAAFFILLLVAAFVVRLYKLNSSLTDWHSWRQVDTSAVSRSFVQKGFDILHPTFEDISNVPSGLDNPHGYRFVEFPIYNILQAGGFLLFHMFTLEEWGRMVTIIASLFSLTFIFLLARKYIGAIGAFFASGFFAFDPYSIYYSRVVLPDPSMVASTLACIYFFDKYVSSKKKISQSFFLILSVLFGAVALLLKPYALFFFLPLLVLAFQKWHWKLFFQPILWISLAIVVAPLLWWRHYMLAYPAGIPASDWLFNAGNIRFTGAYFYWIFANRFAEIILGLWGLPLFFFGILSTKKSFLLFLSFVASSLAYVTVIARGNVQHDYYQILIIPSIALMVGLGVDWLIYLSKEYSKKLAVYIVIALSCLGSLGFGWYFVRNDYDTNPTLVAAGQAVDRLTPKDAKILTFRDGDTTLLYYTNRQGWSSLEKSLPDMITMGADDLLIINPTQNDLGGLGKQYGVVESTNQYLILNLHEVEKK